MFSFYKEESMATNVNKTERDKALEAAIAQIDKRFGKGSIMSLGDDSARLNIEAIPTGSISLDIACGVGGVPKGRIIEIYGPESSGYAKGIGVDIDDLLVSQPDTGEDALEICEMLVRSGAIAVVVIDSVAALVPKAEIQGDMGDSHVGLQARLMSQALRKLTGVINKTNTTCIFINQLREKVGVMFGNPETTTGGRALKFYSSMRLDVRRIESIKVGDAIVGNRTRVKVVKNKVAPPFKMTEFDIMYGKGISRAGDVLDCSVEAGLLEKSGAWYSYAGERIGQGRENVKNYLDEHPELMAKLEEQIRAKYVAKKDDTLVDDSDSIKVDADGVVIEE